MSVAALPPDAKGSATLAAAALKNEQTSKSQRKPPGRGASAPAVVEEEGRDTCLCERLRVPVDAHRDRGARSMRHDDARMRSRLAGR